jgi:predicted Zn-dependent peptidase
MSKIRHEIETLDNGLTVVMEHLPQSKSVAIGFTIGSGSAFEPEKLQGISHLIEHMLFKGTLKRTAKDIAQEIDTVGGKINAHTAKEFTCYYAVVLYSHLDIALDILSDIYLNSQITDEDLEKEKMVILEEIAMYEDTPDENIHDVFAKNILKDHPLGREILGTTECLKNITRQDIKKYISQQYVPNNTIISVAGNYNKTELMNTIKKHFAQLSKVPLNNKIPPATYFGGLNIVRKETEQVHLCLGTKGISFEDPARYTLSLLSVILGGSMSSRLFQKIREASGLAYSVFSYPSFYSNAGLFSIYAGTNNKNIHQVLDLIVAEISQIKDQPLNETELYNAKEHLKGNMVLSLESTENKMNWLGKAFFYYKEIKDLEEIFKKIDQVTCEDIQKLAYTLFSQEQLQLTIIGNVKKITLPEL